MRNKVDVTAAVPTRPGVFLEKEGLHITTPCPVLHKTADEYGIVLYDKESPGGTKIPFPKDARIGRMISVTLKGYRAKGCSYLFYCGDELYQDPYARQLEKDTQYGSVSKKMVRCRIADNTFDWQGDRQLRIPYEDSLIYALHVRGFTKHKSSGVKKKGTFAGLTEKLEYLKELGITSILMMPAYEFNEILPTQKKQSPSASAKINYWGYQKGLYYAPKGAYAYSKDVNTEFREMVRCFHQNGIEVMMQFYFPPEIRHTEIVAVLDYWVTEYHIDGFHVMGVDMPITMLAQEPLLSDTKLLTEHFYPDAGFRQMGESKTVALMNDGYLYEMRKFLKGDDNMMNRFLHHMRNSSSDIGIINYIARWDGMRLRDLVSYDRKHNEKNGEANQDGTDYNCSWNCGVEGKSRKKAIVQLRQRQMMNALAFVMLSQGTPLLYSGDEFGFSQEGNNNPYCQDNAISWINWNLGESGAELLEHCKELIRLRRSHRVFRGGHPVAGGNPASGSYPDISFHGRDAWKPDTCASSRCVGIMFCEGDFLLYMGVNTHWEEHTLGLPQLPEGSRWVSVTEADADCPERQEIIVPARTVSLYHARQGFPVLNRKNVRPRSNKKQQKEEVTDNVESVASLQNDHTP